MGPRDSKCDDHSTNELRKQAAAWMRDHPQRFEVLLLQIRWTSACSSPTHNREPYDTLLMLLRMEILCTILVNGIITFVLTLLKKTLKL